MLKPFPPRSIEQAILTGVYSTRDRSICRNQSERFTRDLPVLPFNGDVECGALVVWVVRSQWPLVGGNLGKLPYNLTILIS